MATDLRKVPAGQTERLPRPRGAHAAGQRSAASRSAAASLCAAAAILIAVPLAVSQIHDAIAWSLLAQVTDAGPDVAGSLLRAAGLALPAMAVAAPFGALAVRRFRAGPVLVAGLLAVAVADTLGDLARTVLLIGVDRTLHGLGAGVCLAAAAGIVAERRQASRSLVGWWAWATVYGLTAMPALMRHRVIADGWHAALQPYPWLAGVALALAALYVVLAEGTAPLAVRITYPPAERALVALLAAPVAGLCAIAVAVTGRGSQAVAAAAIASAIAVTGLSVVAGAASTAGRLAGVCAVTGFTVVPAAETVTTIVPPAELGPEVGGVMAAAAAFGAALALAWPGTGRRGTAAGLFVAAAAFGALYLAGGAITHADILALVGAPLAGGMTAALAAAWRNTGTGGAVCGVVLLLAGVVGGSIAVAAVQRQVLRGARASGAVHAALVLTTADWALISAGLTGVLALLTAARPARR